MLGFGLYLKLFLMKSKFAVGAHIRYIGGMLKYKNKTGTVSRILFDKDTERYYYQTSFSLTSHGSCWEDELEFDRFYQKPREG
jgi:hypothetical protein